MSGLGTVMLQEFFQIKIVKFPVNFTSRKLVIFTLKLLKMNEFYECILYLNIN